LHAAQFNKNLELKLTSGWHIKIIVAIGEVGLDKVCRVPRDQQLEAFTFQFEMAQRYQFPLIIYFVKAYSELIPFCSK